MVAVVGHSAIGEDEQMGNFVSHVTSDGKREDVATHLAEVAEMAAGFAKGFGGEDLARLAGLAHDIGKYSDAFQDRILRGGHKVDHSTAGAYELYKRGLPESLLAYCVAGHHGGLPDGGSEKSDTSDDPTVIGRMKRAEEGRIPPYRSWVAETRLPESVTYLPVSTECTDDSFFCSFLARMLYSCLVDADFLCTERFVEGRGREMLYASIKDLAARLNAKTEAFYPPQTELNALRCGLLDDCRDAASRAPGLFTLTAPTGSGKTIASLSFALNHAKIHGMQRVIYAIPYTSIIEQNARVFRGLLGDSNVVEAHSNITFDENDPCGDEPSPLRLAIENWDAPVVVTTNVQFFESFYSCKPSRNRKLHNIANSVIILDEAQSLPIDRLLPCVRVLCELVLRYGCSVVFCTATQPVLSEYLGKFGCKTTEIVSDPKWLAEQLKRVTYRYIGKVSDEDLACRLKVHEQVLCVVNSRKQARVLFELVGGGVAGEGIYHLSTCMHSVHRMSVIEEIRQRLKDHLPCRVISTSLIEAGVDIDFPVVYRAVAGADSIVQAAGRCNRNGTNFAKGVAYVFDEVASDGDACSYTLPCEVKRRADITKGLIREHAKEGNGEESNDTISRYMESIAFTEDFYLRLCGTMVGRMDKGGALEAMSKKDGTIAFLSYQFRTVSDGFSLIENTTASVVYPDEEIKDILRRLEYGDARKGDFGKVMRYAVGVYLKGGDLKNLEMLGAIRLVATGMYVLQDVSWYDGCVGLRTDVAGGQAVMY